MSKVVVLHISDLHFGIENDKSEATKHVRLRQREMLSSLIKTIQFIVSNDPDWKPNVIAVSGDISWTGQASEYQLYKKEFVEPLSLALNINEDRIITCPGNHDIMRSKAQGLSRHLKDNKNPDVNELDNTEITKQGRNFEGYVSELCDGDVNKLCRLVTYDEWPWISFLSLNSAWDCRDDRDEGRLRVGLSLFEDLIENVPNNNYVITLFHHPHTEVDDYVETIDPTNHLKVLTPQKRKWLHISETQSSNQGDRCFSTFVEQKSTFILNGHIHKETEPKKLHKSIQLISGTLYSKDTPKYHCRLLRLSDCEDPVYRDMRRNINDDSDTWEITYPKEFQFEHIAILLSRKKQQEEKNAKLANDLRLAIERCELDNNVEQLMQVVSTIAGELSHNATISSDVLNKENSFVSEKTTNLEQIDILTLGKGGAN